MEHVKHIKEIRYKNTKYWDVTSFRLVDIYPPFSVKSWLRRRGMKNYSLSLKKERICSPETS
jgi:hypothetical protein